MKYTEGPWRHENGTIYGKGQGHPFMWFPSIAKIHQGTEADAKLISAAPDLLEALKECEDLVSAFLGEDVAVYKQIKAAINKAENNNGQS